MSDLRWRLIQSSTASGVNLMARMAEQLLLVPILLGAWSVELFGEWVLLAAIPTYFLLSDLGFVTSGSNELARRSELESEDSVRDFFADYTASFMRWSVLVFAVIVALAWLVPFHGWLGIEKLSETQTNLVFTLLVADALVSMNGLALLAGLRARRLLHVGLLLRAGSSIAILSLVMIGVTWFDAGPVEAAAIQVCVRLVEFAVHLVILKRQRLTVPFSPLHRNREPMRPFVITGLEYMLFPMGEAMLLQGMTLLVGVFTTPVVVAAFATHRTLSRLTAQVLLVAVNPVRAEAGLMQGEANRHELARVVISASRLTLWASLILVAILLAFGGWIFATWTHGRVSFDAALLAVLACATVIEGVWRVPSSVRLGTNRHRPLATGFLFSSLLGLASAAVLVFPAGIVGMAWGMVIAQLAMCLITIPLTTPLIGMGNAAYLRAVAHPPLGELRAGWRMIRSRIG